MTLITAEELATIMSKSKINADVADISDTIYALPKRSWINSVFAQVLKNTLKSLNLDKYEEEINDCDDFSGYSRSLAKLIHRNTIFKGAALAFGIFNYYNKDGDGHSINFYIDNTEGKKVFFFEPQSCKEIVLTSSEMYLCKGYFV